CKSLLSREMHSDLEALAKTGELTFEEIPSIKTIKGWIRRYSANFKKKASEQALTKANSDASRLLVVNVKKLD
ncbi:45140_t:CDS:1, partial [Gigaspora margarita]